MTTKAKQPQLVGHYFHSLKDGRVHWQGHVIGSPEPGWYLLELFSWLTGSPNGRRIAHIIDMHNWLFYEDSEAMVESYEHGEACDGGPYRPRQRPEKCQCGGAPAAACQGCGEGASS